jgi:hypothetical protein
VLLAAGREVRCRIEGVGTSGAFAGPDGVTTRWTLLTGATSVVRPAERDDAMRLARN